MTETMAPAVHKPIWVDLSSSDPAASREFYSKLFGWQVEVHPDPQYGGYAVAKIGGKDAAGIGPKMMPEAPTAWSIYIWSPDAAELGKKVQAAGGKVIAPPDQVGDQGTMAVFQDPSGAYVSAWQPAMMEGGLTDGQAGTLAWAELSSRGLDKAVAFYQTVFGWTTKTTPMGEGRRPYTEFLAGGASIAGATEMDPMVPAQVPSYWMAYFAVADLDASFKKAIGMGATELVAPVDYPGGRFAIVSDPQGATFGLLKATPR
jgi:predicted enzyme related to lactoylglutathione lyase